MPLLVQLAVLSFVTGGSMAAIVLGHWYLVTPKISERPLILQCRLLLAGLILQALLFVTWTTLGGGPGQTALLGLHDRAGPARGAPPAGHDRVPDRPVVDGLADGSDTLDGVGHGPAVHQLRGCAGRHDRRRRAVRLEWHPRLMRIKVRLFAMLRQQAGWREREFELPDGATIGDAWQLIVNAAPALAPQRDIVRFARNREYATADEPLSDGDELALIPPVAGGRPTIQPQPTLTCAWRSAPSQSATTFWRSCATRFRPTSDGAYVVFLGQTRDSAGTPAPAEEVEAAKHAGKPVVRHSTTRSSTRWRSTCCARSRARSSSASA